MILTSSVSPGLAGRRAADKLITIPLTRPDGSHGRKTEVAADRSSNPIRRPW
jgi:hypothetical protein